MPRGTYSNGKKLGSLFIKKIQPLSKIEEKIYNELNYNTKIVKEYVNDIKKLGIKCSPVYYVSRKYIIEKYIKGSTVDEYINSENHLEEKIKVILKVLDLFEKSLKNENIRIDWNLKNFIINDNNIILVDYVPTIYKQNLEKIQTDFTEDLYKLYINTDIQLAGILGYSIMPFLNSNKEEFRKIYNILKKKINNIYKIEKSKSHIFIDRIFLIEEYLSNEDIKQDDFIKEYKALSLSKKMKEKLKEKNL